MDYSEAAEFVMPFGKYEGQKLDKIAESDEGLRYLDWLRGSGHAQGKAQRALDAYCSDEVIASEIKKLVGTDD